MEPKKLKLIKKILKMNTDFTAKNIPIVFDRIKNIKQMSDTEFDENPELGREAKEKMLFSLQHQMGYLSAMQSETMKFINLIFHLDGDEAIDQLEGLIERSRESNEKLEEEIKNNLPDND